MNNPPSPTAPLFCACPSNVSPVSAGTPLVFHSSLVTIGTIPSACCVVWNNSAGLDLSTLNSNKSLYSKLTARFCATALSLAVTPLSKDTGVKFSLLCKPKNTLDTRRPFPPS